MSLEKKKIEDFIRNQCAFDDCGFSNIEIPDSDRSNLEEYIDLNYEGEMRYMRDIEIRTNSDSVLPGAKSAIVVTLNYYRSPPLEKPEFGWVASYAYGRDYHKVFRQELKKLVNFLETNWPSEKHRICVDSAPLMEKVLARKAGLGFYGKNTLLINQKKGSFFLLAEVLTTIKLSPSKENEGTCGSCTRCIDSCPTGAIKTEMKDGKSYPKIDARRCISYLTIENKAEIPDDLIPLLKNNLFGCDICQNVCPYNNQFAHSPAKSQKELLQPKIAGSELSLLKILQIKTAEQFQTLFAGSPVMRAKRFGLVRNAIYISANQILYNQITGTKQTKLIQAITKISQQDSDHLLRQIAKNQLQRIGQKT